jgi:two-component system OmpR family response regulator
MRVLVIEDDAAAAGHVRRILADAGHEVDAVLDAERGLAVARNGDFDVLVVDRMMPRLDGLELVRQLRDDGPGTPVLFLSALGEVEDRVEGLKAGGDDYLPKGADPVEIVARVEALGRRKPTGVDGPVTHLAVGDLELDLLSRKVTRGGKRIDLQPREFKLLEVLMRHEGQVVTRMMLLEQVWNYHFDPMTNVVDVHISRLRSKIEKEAGAPILHTVRGHGYRLQA